MVLDQEAKDKFLSEIAILAQERNETVDDAFSAWIVENLLGIDDSQSIDEAVEIGGKNDFGIDFFHVNDKTDEENFISWGQAKFSKTLDKKITREEFNDFVVTVGKLESPPPTANRVLQTKSDEFNSYKNRFSKRMLLVFTGELNQQVKDMLNDNIYVASKKDPNTTWEIIDLEKILQFVTVPTTLPLTISFEKPFLKINDPVTKKDSLLGYVKGKEIVRICSDPKNKNRMFLENPRESLGITNTNKGISNTLKNPDLKQNFWKLSNGITATCSKISDETDADNKFLFENFKIVNGRQTSWSLTQNKGLVDDTVTVQLIVHNTADQDERNMISKTTNSQNPIKPADIITNDPLIRKLDIDFKKYNKWFFEIQRGGFRILSKPEKTIFTKRRCLEKEPMARRFLAFNGKPRWAITVTEKELFLIPQNINILFENSKAIDFINSHIFYRILLELDKNWKDDDTKLNDWKYLHKVIVKFYILALIGDTLEQMNSSEKKDVLKNIYDRFNQIDNDSKLDPKLLEIGSAAYYNFRIMFGDLTSLNQGIMDDDEMKKFLFKEEDFYEKLKNKKRLQKNILPDPIDDKLKFFISQP